MSDIRIILESFSLTKYVATRVTWILLGYWVLEAVRALSGKQTSADLGLNLISNLFELAPSLQIVLLSVLVGILGLSCGIFGVLFGLNQSRLRRDAVKALAPAQKDEEIQLIPDRGSSKLTPDGRTNKGDV